MFMTMSCSGASHTERTVVGSTRSITAGGIHNWTVITNKNVFCLNGMYLFLCNRFCEIGFTVQTAPLLNSWRYIVHLDGVAYMKQGLVNRIRKSCHRSNWLLSCDHTLLKYSCMH